jgi:hypothetical protein
MATRTYRSVAGRYRWSLLGSIAFGICLLAGWRAPTRDTVGCVGAATTIAPCLGSADTLFASATGQRSFTVTNGESNALTYTSSCAVTSSVSSCTVDQAAITVPAGGAAGFTVLYTASSSSADGTVTVALDGGGSDQVAAVIAVTTSTASTRSP